MNGIFKIIIQSWLLLVILNIISVVKFDLVGKKFPRFSLPPVVAL